MKRPHAAPRSTLREERGKQAPSQPHRSRIHRHDGHRPRLAHGLGHPVVLRHRQHRRSLSARCARGDARRTGPSCRRPSSDCWSSLPSSCFSDGSSAAGSVPCRFCASITGMKDERPAEKAGRALRKPRPARRLACASCISGGKGDEVASTDGRTDADRAGRNPGTGPFWVLGGALASSAVFGFPVFCLICPVGLTFALVIALWRLFEFNEPSLSIVFFAGFLILELFVLRRWCHAFCPLAPS